MKNFRLTGLLAAALLLLAPAAGFAREQGGVDGGRGFSGGRAFSGGGGYRGGHGYTGGRGFEGPGTIGIGATAGIIMVLARASTLDMAHLTTVPIPTLLERAATMMLMGTGTPYPDATRPIRTGPIDVLLSEPVNVK